MNSRLSLAVATAALLNFSLPVNAQTIFSECLQEAVLSASAQTTVAQLRDQCKELTAVIGDKIDTLIEEEKIAEETIATNAFSLLQHKANYVLPLSYNYKAEQIEPSSVPGDARELDPTEFKFQLSFKTRLLANMFGTRANFYAAYTNTSWWQAYNKAESSPFRETNHQPELFLELPTAWRHNGWELAAIKLGAEHNSNGRSGEFSRSWNRLFTQVSFSNEFNKIHIKPWFSLSDIEDNPDIEDFRGRIKISGEHLFGKHELNWALRHTLDNNNRASIEANWSYPIRGRDDLKFFVQYFDGYGESLIDYNLEARRVGLGFKLGQ